MRRLGWTRRLSSGQGSVAKGGSFLCHASYCNRYRVAARTPEHSDSSLSHTGFRLAAARDINHDQAAGSPSRKARLDLERSAMLTHRFPQWIYRHGTEPDPRFSLANERTFLAWIRTSLALFAAGVALKALTLPVDAQLRTAAAIVFVMLGLVAAAQSWLGWARTERALRQGTALPGPSSSSVLAAGVLVGTLLIAVGLLQ